MFDGLAGRMKISIRDGYIFSEADFSSPIDPSEAKNYLRRLFEICRKRRTGKILLDCRKLKGPFHFTLLLDLAQFLACEQSSFCIALWVLEKQITPDKFLETYLTNRGLRIKDATRLDEAVKWLKSQPSATFESCNMK